MSNDRAKIIDKAKEVWRFYDRHYDHGHALTAKTLFITAYLHGYMAAYTEVKPKDDTRTY